jgi:outer membrane protein, heavy metal efflux system
MTKQYTFLIATGLCQILAIGCALPKPRPMAVPMTASMTENASQNIPVIPTNASVQLTSYEEVTKENSSSGIVVAVPSTPSVLTMDELVALALANNPSIHELAATTQKAAGFKTQVGLKPNPIVAYQAIQLADRGTDQHVIFGEQEFVTANKLELNRRVLNESLRTQLHELEAQKLRVETDVKISFYQILALQKQNVLIKEFLGVTERGFELTQQRLQASEVSKVDVLQSQVQKNEMELALRQNQAKLQATWRRLVALTGLADLPLAKLDGEFPVHSNAVDWQTLQMQLIQASPEYAATQANISRARAELERHDVQAVPNLTVQLGPGYDNGTNSGMLNLQVGAPIPVFNQNQGNLAAARAEYCRAVKEAQRIESSIRSRLAEVSGEYEMALEAVKQYQELIIPATRESHALAELAYKVGELGFVQTLVARRSYFDANLQLVASQAQLASAQSRVDGILLTGALDPVSDRSGSDSLRGLTIGQR